MPMTHAQIDARSLEAHRLIADRLEKDPSLRTKALENLDRWEAQNRVSSPYFVRWRALLVGDIQDLLTMMRSPSEDATAMRQAAPFAGPDFISQEERLALIVKYATSELEHTA
jgi:hypothetical protein